MEYQKLVELIESDKRLGSTTEYCAAACATGDLSRAPEPYQESIEKAWAELDEAQRETVLLYLKRHGMRTASKPASPFRPADKSKFEVVESLASKNRPEEINKILAEFCPGDEPPFAATVGECIEHLKKLPEGMPVSAGLNIGVELVVYNAKTPELRHLEIREYDPLNDEDFDDD